MNSDTLIRAQNLSKTYKSKAGQLQVLHEVNLEIAHGELLAITGQSGVGKSTLLNMLGLLDQPTDGSVHMNVDNVACDAATLPRSERARIRNRHIGFVFQFYHLLPDLTVLDNVLLPAMICRTTSGYREDHKALLERAHHLLTQVDVQDRDKHRPSQLSGGERQRVAIARALMNRPDLLLCDEPTGNLDTVTSETIHALFLELNRTLGTAILIVTHDENLAQLASRRLHMVDGRFVNPPAPAAGE